MEKISLPIKTKIAAWWMIVTGLVYLIINLIMPISESPDRPPLVLLFIPLFILLGLFFLWPAIFILKRKKWAWYVAVIILFMIMAMFIYIFPFQDYFAYKKVLEMTVKEFLFIVIMFLSPLISFILLFLDRKNFWKIAS